MIKLYIKKLLWTILFFVVFIFTAGVVYIPITLIMSEKVYMETFRLILSLIVAVPILIAAVYVIRTDNRTCKIVYIDNHPTKQFNFGRDFISTLRSKENIIHTIAYLTLSFFCALPTGLAATTQPIHLIVGLIYLLVTRGLIFTLANTLIWCFVHRKWLQRYKPSFENSI